MALYNHIEELKAELRNCTGRRERAQIAAELKAAQAQLARHEAAFDEWLAAAG